MQMRESSDQMRFWVEIPAVDERREEGKKNVLTPRVKSVSAGV